MLRISKIGVAVFGGAAIFLATLQPAAAVRCELITATNSAKSKADAARAAQQNARDTAEQIRRQRGWSYVSLRAKKVTPDPFWKSVRPEVRDSMLLKPDIVTSESYTQCWRGVVVPFVCTAGAAACGN
jgi:hypothetical protein